MAARRSIAALAAALVLLSAIAPAAAALSFVEGNAPNPAIEADTTIDSYDVTWGDNLQYEDDSGSVTDLPASVNSSTDVDNLGNGHVNPYTFSVTDMEFEDAGAFPHDSNDSALDASEWTTTGASLTNTTTAPGVEAVEFSASASGDQASYSTSITSDAEKKYFQAFYDVKSASGATQVTATIHDATDGDTATVMLYDASANTADAAVGANSTGEGKAMQVQVGKLSASGGDSSIDEIGKIVVSADGAATVDMSAVNMDKTSKYAIGEQYVNTDTSDSDLETETIYEATGPVSVNSVTTLGTTFDDATIHGLTAPMLFEASELSDADRKTAFESDNAFPNWDVVADLNYRLELPSAYDLSYANAELKQTQKWPATRYATVQIAEGAGDTNFDDISTWTDLTADYNTEDQDLTLDSTVSVGTEYAVSYDIKLTGQEADAMQQSMQAGGGGIFGSSSGGIVGFFTSIPGLIVGGVGALAGGRYFGWV